MRLSFTLTFPRRRAGLTFLDGGTQERAPSSPRNGRGTMIAIRRSRIDRLPGTFQTHEWLIES